MAIFYVLHICCKRSLQDCVYLFVTLQKQLGLTTSYNLECIISLFMTEVLLLLQLKSILDGEFCN